MHYLSDALSWNIKLNSVLRSFDDFLAGKQQTHHELQIFMSLMFYAFNPHVALKAHRHQVKHWGKQREIAIRSSYGFQLWIFQLLWVGTFEWVFFLLLLELFLVVNPRRSRLFRSWRFDCLLVFENIEEILNLQGTPNKITIFDS